MRQTPSEGLHSLHPELRTYETESSGCSWRENENMNVANRECGGEGEEKEQLPEHERDLRRNCAGPWRSTAINGVPTDRLRHCTMSNNNPQCNVQQHFF